jgi:hypothetical protein
MLLHLPIVVLATLSPVQAVHGRSISARCARQGLLIQTRKNLMQRQMVKVGLIARPAFAAALA